MPGRLELILLAIIPGLAKLIESAIAENYNQEAELQALFQMQRSLADQRVKNALIAAGKAAP